jgi:hypothetical protein
VPSIAIQWGDYNPLLEAIKQSPKWWHFLQSTWLIQTTETPNQIWERLRPFIDTNDFLMIIEVRDNAQGWLPKEAWDWIHTNTPSP